MKTTVTITKDYDGEFRVPSPDGSEAGAYYTDDKEDAEGTVRNFMYKDADQIVIKYRRVDVHPEN